MQLEEHNTKKIRKRAVFLAALAFVSLLIFGIGIFTVRAVSFENPSATLGLGTSDLKETVINIINWALGLLGIVAVIFLIYGGYTWLTAGGEEERIRRAKKIIINTLIGLVIILLAWAIVRFVLNFGNSVSGPGSGSACTEGSSRGCWDCSGGDWVYDSTNGPECLLSPETFEIRNIVTSCETPTNYREDVYKCSAITTVFNHVVDGATVQQNTENDNLIVEQCDSTSDLNNCNNPSQPTPLFNAIPPFTNQIEYSGAMPKGDRAEIVANGKSFTFLHAQTEFQANTYYRLKIPKASSGLKDVAGRQLTGCTLDGVTPVPGCDGSAATYFSWIFQVGTKNDPVPPALTSSYPVFSTDPKYPDRNVNRSAILSATFSEAIAPWTITEDNIKVFGFDPADPPADDGTGGTRNASPISGLVPADNYDVFLSKGGNGFELVFKGGFQLEAFSWYEIEVNNLKDLCANTQTPAPLIWRFQTNGVGAGIGAVYPPDGYLFACPSTEVFVRFNTTMYDPATSSCGVPPVGDGFVTGGTLAPPPARMLAVEDPVPPSGDPNDYCKKYSFLPVANPLNSSTSYSAKVTTRYQIDRSGGTLGANWGFTTATPDTCADPPVITKLSPDTGPAGRCLSVIGNYFDPDGDNQGPADSDKITFSGNDANSKVKRWSQRAIVLTAPDIGASGPSPVSVTVNYPAPIGPLTTASTMDFNYTAGTFSGACLTQLNPDSGLRDQGYQLLGEDFDKSSSNKIIHFGGIDVSGNWTSETVANSAVPSAAPFGVNLVSLENDAGISNELPFNLMSVPPATFQLIDFVPNCGSACSNASVRARFSQTLLAASVTAGSVELYKCADASCAASGLTKVTTALSYPGGIDVFFPQAGGLAVPDVWYRAVIHGGFSGVTSADGKELGNLNYDADGTAGNDSSSWTFKTSSTGEACTLATVTCQPPVSSVPVGGTRGYQSLAFSNPNACNPGGEELNPWAFNWNWSSSDASRVTVSPATPDPVTTATGVQATLPATPAEVRAATSGKNAQCSLTVTTTTCVTDGDCVDNPTAGACPRSSCRSGVCTPTVTSISPTSGAVGDWLTISGCYFDSYVDGQSKALFLQDAANPDLAGLWPAPSVCGAPGSTWKDRQIIVEVPNKRDGDTSDTDDVRVEGPLRVVRGTDLQQADSSQTFTPGGSPTPGICRVTPGAGQAGITKLRLQGQNFGAPPPGVNDQVVLYDGTPGGIGVPGAAATWVSDSEVKDVTVPQTAVNNPGSNPSAPWNGNTNELYLSKNAQKSNLVNFDVIPPSCSVCSNDIQCGGSGVSQGCGKSGAFQCCTNRPVISVITPTNPPPTCRNALVTASFVDAVTSAPIPMNKATINPANVLLRNVTDGVDVPLTAGDFRFPSLSSFEVNPGLLLGGKTYQVTIVGDSTINQDPPVPEGVLSTTGVGLNGNKVWNFTTSNSVCQLARIVLSPANLVFTTLASSQSILALTYDQNGLPIAPIPGVYDWSWTWNSDASGIATVTSSNSPSQPVSSVANGSTLIHATATGTAGWTETKTGSANVQVNACASPWPGTPPYLDSLPPSTNYSTWYCRDQGNLPAVNAVGGTNTPVADGVDELLRQFFFEDPNVNPATQKNDAVGLLVWENEEHLSPAAWYEKKFGERVGGATSKADGYEAMRVGTTIYIAGTNLSGGILYSNMYVLGRNDDAGAEISSIYNQMLNNFKINANSSAFVYAGTDAATALLQVRRDADRRGDLMDYQRVLTAYQLAAGSYPTLPAGTYLAGMSTSVWPSWAETLGEALRERAPSRAVNHVDPLNDLVPQCTAPFDPRTCWDELDKKFFCQPDSHIYAYQAVSGGSQYDLFGHMEYLGTGSWRTGLSLNPCSSPSSCDCFNFQLTGAASGSGGSADTSPPSAPENLSANTVSDSQIKLIWTLSTDTGGSGVQSYELFRSVDSVSFGSPFVTIADPSASFDDTGLAADTTYYYKARAKDFAGNLSDFSNIAQATTASGGDLVPPGNVGALTATPGDTQVTLTWSDPIESDYSGAAVYRKDGTAGSFLRSDPAATLINANVPKGTETIVVNGLTDGQTYTFGVFTFDGVPNFANGAFVTGTPVLGIYPFDVTDVVATPGDATVTITWTNPSDAAFQGVRIRRSTTAFPVNPTSDGTLVADVTKTLPSIVSIGPLTNGTKYYFTLFAYDTSRFAAGAQVSATPQASAFASNITNFVAVSGDAQVFLTWQNPSDAAYAGVKILKKTGAFPSGPGDGSATIVTDAAKPVTSFTDTSVLNGTTYFYAAYAHDGVPTYASGVFAQATPDNGPPGIASVDVPAMTISLGSARIAWQTTEAATTSIEIGTSPSLYELGTFTQGAFITDHEWKSADWAVVLQPNTKYHFRISATDMAGNATTDIDHIFVTDVLDANTVRWHGYFETQPVATWNGSTNAALCNNTCNQYYVCAASGTPDCSDARNAALGAGTSCGALAIADCLDGRADLPQGGNGTLTQAILDAWGQPVGTRLPKQAEYQTACAGAPKPQGMPYPAGVWGMDLDASTSLADFLGESGGASSCSNNSQKGITNLAPFMIVDSDI